MRRLRRWGMVFWLDGDTLRWRDEETGERGILTRSDDPHSQYQLIRKELTK